MGCNKTKRIERMTIVAGQIILWQGSKERSDWFFLGWDFAIWTVSMETNGHKHFLISKAANSTTKPGPSTIQQNTY